MICGNDRKYFPYRTGYYLTRFFENAETDFVYDGSGRESWVKDVLEQIMLETPQQVNMPPEPFLRVIRELMDLTDRTDLDDNDRTQALAELNATLFKEGFEAFYADDSLCYLRNRETNTIGLHKVNPHRPFSAVELLKKAQLEQYLAIISEDQLIEEILLPLFRQLGFHRITATGHKDKALEYGKDIWMRYTLPTQHLLYFGIQVKKGKLDSAGATKGSNVNIAEVYNQVQMMIGHEIFDSELGRRVLVDHAFIVAGGEITKAARNWIGNKLDAVKRSQIIFMERDDIINLYSVTTLPLPIAALADKKEEEDEFPF